MRRACRLFTLVAVLAALWGCALSGGDAEQFLWPEHSGPYVQATKDWTRGAVIYDGVNVELAATATLKARPWREAFAAKSAEVYSLDQAEAAGVLADETAAHEAGTDVVLALESPRYGNEKLSLDGVRWKVFALQGENKLYPLEIRAMSRKFWPDTKRKAFFPYYTRWQTFYDLSFERLAPGPVKLVVSGPAGIVELDWERFE